MCHQKHYMVDPLQIQPVDGLFTKLCSLSQTPGFHSGHQRQGFYSTCLLIGSWSHCSSDILTGVMSLILKSLTHWSHISGSTNTSSILLNWISHFCWILCQNIHHILKLEICKSSCFPKPSSISSKYGICCRGVPSVLFPKSWFCFYTSIFTVISCLDSVTIILTALFHSSLLFLSHSLPKQ